MIVADDLNKEYQIPESSSGFLQHVSRIIWPQYTTVSSVKNVAFSIAEGECVGLIGPNGAGKSTIIKLLTGILKPTSGSISVFGMNPYADRINYVKNIGVVFGQRSQLWDDLKVIDSYKMLQKMYFVDDADFESRLKMFAESVGISPLLSRYARTLSLGQRILCEIAAAFLHNPKIVFLDEPTIGLDLEIKMSIRSLIKNLNREIGTTVLITSHDVGDIETLCNRLLVIHQGSIMFDGSVGSFKSKAGNARALAIRVPAEHTHAAVKTLRDTIFTPKFGITVEYDWISFHGEWDIPPYAKLISLLEPSGIVDMKIVEKSLEDIILGYYANLKQGLVCAPAVYNSASAYPT